jgi:hypothetical protein
LIKLIIEPFRIKILAALLFNVFLQPENKLNMRKVFFLLAFAAAITVIASCKAHEKCPAYGKAGSAPSGQHS